MAGPAGVKSVLTEVELLAALDAERILHEPLPADVAQIEPHRLGRVVDHRVLTVEPLEQVLHLLEMIRVAPVALTAAGLAVFDRRKDLDLHHMPPARLRVDRALADVAGVMQHTNSK